MYLISVYFDQTVTQKLQNYIAEIAKRTGNHFMTDHQVPPHLTISSVEARSAEVLLPHMPVLEEKLKKVPIWFVSVGAFFPGVLYAAPLLDRPLQVCAITVLIRCKSKALSILGLVFLLCRTSMKNANNVAKVI